MNPPGEEPLNFIHCDMPKDMVQELMFLFRKFHEKFHRVEDVAYVIRKTFDFKYGPLWTALIGVHFAAHVTYEPGHYAHFYAGQTGFVLYRSHNSLFRINLYEAKTAYLFHSYKEEKKKVIGGKGKKKKKGEKKKPEEVLESKKDND